MAFYEISTSGAGLAKFELDLVGSEARRYRVTNNSPDRWYVCRIWRLSDGATGRVEAAPASGVKTTNIPQAIRSQIVVTWFDSDGNGSLDAYEIDGWQLQANLLPVGMLPADSGI